MIARPFLVAACVIASAASFAQWLYKNAVGKLRAELDDRFDHWLGWFAPAMDAHWVQAADAARARDLGALYHALKNVSTEWTRSDAQRSSKVLMFVAVTGWTLVVGLGVALIF